MPFYLVRIRTDNGIWFTFQHLYVVLSIFNVYACIVHIRKMVHESKAEHSKFWGIIEVLEYCNVADFEIFDCEIPNYRFWGVKFCTLKFNFSQPIFETFGSTGCIAVVQLYSLLLGFLWSIITCSTLAYTECIATTL